MNDKIINALNKDDRFLSYYKELISYNEKVNLTAITDKEEVFIKHFYDSLLGAEFVPENASLLDIGTGAGFPGLPLKIFRQDIKLTLVDSLNKRIEFLKHLSPILNFKYDCIHSRAEDFAHSSYREQFDVVTARAVASLNTLCEYTLPLVKVGGMFLAYKGANAQEELNVAEKAIKLLGGKIESIHEFELPNSMGSRSIVVIRKIKSTPTKFPRGKNLPKLKPLS